MPAGAEVLAGGKGVHFRVWAPDHEKVDVLLYDPTERAFSLSPEPSSGYFSALFDEVSAGTLYRYRLSGDTFPDPASRFQPNGPHQPSQVINPDTFEWTDRAWRGVGLRGQVIYEMHVGTFTPEGTWQCAATKLEFLRDVGITVIEVMPVSEFGGTFGWGYDGVHPFAPTRIYGTPDDFRSFVNQAHNLGIGVVLDVVYNHLGPEGNYFGAFSKYYFSEQYKTDWGAAINYDSESSCAVRDFITSNAAYWVREFHLDGLRLDATQDIFDSSAEHILAAICHAAKSAGGERSVIIIAENEPQDTKLVRPPQQNGYGLDMIWNDDYHHSAMVALSGRSEAYYTDYAGNPQEFVSCAKYGFLYQGQWYKWQQRRRGTPSLDTPPARFVTFLQNHDQIANSGRGSRCHQLADSATLRAMTALTLLGPGTPMLFQGQEFAASAPFYYFADHPEELSAQVRQGRIEFMSQFPSVATPEGAACVPDPGNRTTFEKCQLDWSEVKKNASAVRLHSDLLELRRQDPVFSAQRPGSIDGAILAQRAFLLRFFGGNGDDRLLIVNLGADLHVDPAPEPLLAPPEARGWEVLWSSEHPGYGGCGTPPVETEQNWWVPGRSAVVLRPGPRAVTLPSRRVSQKDNDERPDPNDVKPGTG